MAFSIELEEWVGTHWHRWASRAESYARHPGATVALADLARPLAVFFRAGGGDSGLTIKALAGRESRHRLSLRQRLGFDTEVLKKARRDDEALHLPDHIDVFPDADLNRALYFWLAAFFSRAGAPAPESDPLRADILALRAARAASNAALVQFPGLARRYRRLQEAILSVRPARTNLPPAEAAIENAIRQLLGDRPAYCAQQVLIDCVLDPQKPLVGVLAPAGYRTFLPVPLWGTVTQSDTTPRDRPPQHDENIETEQEDQVVQGGARRAKRQRQEQSERDDPLVFNRFEKMLSFSEMVNLNRMVDDDPDDRASKTAEQLEELTLSPQARKAASRLQVELDLAPGAAVASRLQGCYTYPEWDYRKQRYLPDQSRVLTGLHVENEQPWQPDDPATQRRVIRLQRQFEALRPRHVILRGQQEGNELDTDAAVRGVCDQAATGVPSESIYLASRPAARDLAVSVLVDNSLSTDAWLEDRRVIDVSREALWVLAHGLTRCGDDYAIATFTSHRRNKVQFNHIKPFEEPLGERVDRRIAALQPGAYTRMGPAIRHAAAGLALRPNRHRLLLLISDGKPNDTDYYEGRFAIEDTRRAVLDARKQELRVFAITIDRDAGQYIPRLFGRGGYALVNRPEQLSEALPRIYRQITGD